MISVFGRIAVIFIFYKGICIWAWGATTMPTSHWVFHSMFLASTSSSCTISGTIATNNLQELSWGWWHICQYWMQPSIFMNPSPFFSKQITLGILPLICLKKHSPAMKFSSCRGWWQCFWVNLCQTCGNFVIILFCIAGYLR